MEESEVDSYKLNSDDRKQSLRISLINNEKVSMVLINITTKQRHSVLIPLSELRTLCEAFKTIKTIKEALDIIKNTIESGRIMITEDPQNNNIIEIRYNVSIDNKEYPPFDINLTLEKQDNDEDQVEILPPKFDHKASKEDITKYSNLTKSTTAFNKPIIQSDVKPPILELEYIEPILQVHYPDGTVKSQALPPRLQGVNGEPPNISEEQFESIREQISQNETIKNFSPLKELLSNRANSVIKRSTSLYSIQSSNFGINNISRVNPFNPPAEPVDNINRSKAKNDNNNVNRLNRTSSAYSIFAKPNSVSPTDNTKNTNSSLNNIKLNNTNVFINSRYLNRGLNSNHNNIVERRPRMINANTFNPRDPDRSLSTPSHQDFHQFNSSQNVNNYQINQTKNPFQKIQNQNAFKDTNEKYPYDRNTQRNPVINNNIINKSNIQNSSLSHIERQQQRLEVVQKKLAEIQQQQMQLNNLQKQFALQHQQKNQNLIKQIQPRQQLRQQIKIIPKQPMRQNQQMSQNNDQQAKFQSQKQVNQFSSDQNQLKFQSQKQVNQFASDQQQLKFQSQKQVNQFTSDNKLTNNQQFLGNPNSGDIKQNTKQLFNKDNFYKKQTSTPLSSKTPSLPNKDISDQLISLAQIASIQNGENPNFETVQPVTLKEQNQQKEEILDNNNDLVEDTNKENESLKSAEEIGTSENLNIEQLYFTEDGRVIFRNGLLRGIIHKYAEIDDVVTKIQDKLGKGVKFNLAYKAFDVGDKARTFHEKCDILNMSLVLIETDKDVRFGGFTSQSWAGNCQKKFDNNAFVFNIDNNKIFDVVLNEPAIGCYPGFGPVFFGCQIRIFDGFFSRGGTTCHKGLNYKTDIDYELNNGEQKFLIKDIEIYGIETIDI